MPLFSVLNARPGLILDGYATRKISDLPSGSSKRQNLLALSDVRLVFANCSIQSDSGRSHGNCCRTSTQIVQASSDNLHAKVLFINDYTLIHNQSHYSGTPRSLTVPILTWSAIKRSEDSGLGSCVRSMFG
jgi:hypothetical protein